MPVLERIASPEREARVALRAQIARLERELAEIMAATYPAIAPLAAGDSRSARPRLQDLGALERTRDVLAARLSAAITARQDQELRQAAARARLDDMEAHPERHPRARVTNRQLGLPGCTTYSVVRRLTSPWWQLKISGGCPLPSAAR
jgi:hypothetical protein